MHLLAFIEYESINIHYLCIHQLCINRDSSTMHLLVFIMHSIPIHITSFVIYSLSLNIQYSSTMRLIAFIIYASNSIYQVLIVFEYISMYHLIIQSLCVLFIYRSILTIVYSLIIPQEHSTFIIDTSFIILKRLLRIVHHL